MPRRNLFLAPTASIHYLLSLFYSPSRHDKGYTLSPRKGNTAEGHRKGETKKLNKRKWGQFTTTHPLFLSCDNTGGTVQSIVVVMPQAPSSPVDWMKYRTVLTLLFYIEHRLCFQHFFIDVFSINLLLLIYPLRLSLCSFKLREIRVAWYIPLAEEDFSFVASVNIFALMDKTGQERWKG